MDADTIESLINFAYSGKLRITIHNVQSLMVGANFLQLSALVDACCAYLKSRLQGAFSSHYFDSYLFYCI